MPLAASDTVAMPVPTNLRYAVVMDVAPFGSTPQDATFIDQQTPSRHASRCSVASQATAYRRLVGTGIAAVSEEASGILSSDTVESGRKRLLQCLDGARRDPAQIGLHLGPGGLDRAEVGAVGRQIAIGKA